MAELRERKQGDLNTFKEGTDSKTVEKEAINVVEVENYANSIAASIAVEIDEDIANIQAEAIKAVANSLENSVDLGTGEMKQSNLEIEVALNNTTGRGREEGTSRGLPDRSSRTECQLVAYFALKVAEDARLVIAMGQDVMETMYATIDVLKSHIGVHAMKSVEASGRGTERGYIVADFYNTMVSKYEAAIEALQKRILNVEIALNRLKECVNGCVKYAALAEEITDEALDESRQIKFAACWWNNKGRAVIIVALKKERVALFMMRRIWISMRNDMDYEELNRTRPVEDSDEETQQCENRDRKTKIGHIVTTFVGLALTSITCLFKVGSDSFNAILALGLLTTGWCAVYWSVKLYRYLKGNDPEETLIETERPEEDRYIAQCGRRLAIVHAHLRQYNIVLNPDEESDTGSSEAATIDDFSESSMLTR